MKRTLPILGFSLLLLAACASTKPVPAPETEVNPATDPTIVGAIDEAAWQGAEEGAEAAVTGRRVGRVVGVLAAVFGGPERESIDDMIDRYRDTRDAITVTSAAIGATYGAIEGAKRGYEFDLQFAELHEIDGMQVFRPTPDQIDGYFASMPSNETMAAVAKVFIGRTERAIDIDAAGDTAFAMRDALIDMGVPSTSIVAHRNAAVEGIGIRVRYR